MLNWPHGRKCAGKRSLPACLLLTRAPARRPPARPSPPAEAVWNSETKARATRLAQYAAAIRCKWPRVAQWKCASCGIAGTKLINAYVSTPQYENAKDAFTVGGAGSASSEGVDASPHSEVCATALQQHGRVLQGGDAGQRRRRAGQRQGPDAMPMAGSTPSGVSHTDEPSTTPPHTHTTTTTPPPPPPQIHFDSVLNATVVTFRSTYGNSEGEEGAGGGWRSTSPGGGRAGGAPRAPPTPSRPHSTRPPPAPPPTPQHHHCPAHFTCGLTPHDTNRVAPPCPAPHLTHSRPRLPAPPHPRRLDERSQPEACGAQDWRVPLQDARG